MKCVTVEECGGEPCAELRLLAQESLEDFRCDVVPSYEPRMTIVRSANCLQLLELPIQFPDGVLMCTFVVVHTQIFVHDTEQGQYKSV